MASCQSVYTTEGRNNIMHSAILELGKLAGVEKSWLLSMFKTMGILGVMKEEKEVPKSSLLEHFTDQFDFDEYESKGKFNK